MTDDELVAAARSAVKAKGCMCKVEITLRRPDPDVPLYVEADARHDSWCTLALARNRSMN